MKKINIEQQKEYLGKLLESDTHIVVEGKRDKSALQKLGFHKVFDISGKTLESLVEELYKNKINNLLILTDFDKEGQKIYKILSRYLEFYNIKADEKLRKKFKRIFGITKIEELIYYINNGLL